MGERLRTQILRTAKQIIEAGNVDPAIFELVGLFQENVGPDRISDMVGRIIVDDLRAYTQRIFSDLKVHLIALTNQLLILSAGIRLFCYLKRFFEIYP